MSGIRTQHVAQPQSTSLTLEDCVVMGLLLLFFTHLYVPVLEPVQDSLFTAASGDQTITGQLINAGVWLTACAVMFRHARAVCSGARQIFWTTAFSAAALLSTLWSQDPGTTARKAVVLLLTTAFGIYFARRFTVQRQLTLISIAACIISLLSICFAVLLPRYGRDHDAHEGVWVGVFTQKNVCAREMLFILVCLLPYTPSTQNLRWVRRIALLCTLTVIAGTESKTAWLIASLTLFVFPVLRVVRRLTPGLTLTLITTASVVIAAVVAVAASAVPRLALFVGRDATLTGRTEIWQAVVQAILKRPLCGYGFAAFWLALRGESANIILALRWAVPAAHNGFLEIWLQLGALGLLLFLLGFAQAVRTALRRFRSESWSTASWPVAVLLLTIVYNLDESSLMQTSDFLWILYVATLVNLANTDQLSRVAPVTSLARSRRTIPCLSDSLS